MFNDTYSLEYELQNGSFEFQGPQLDTYKLIEALKFLTKKISELEGQQLSQQTEAINQQSIMYSENELLRNELKDCKDIIRKMGRDYPELIIAKPHFFAEEEKNDS